MAATFVVTLREGFEAALLLGIVYACLDRFGARDHYRWVTLGGALGLVASILMGIAVTLLSGPLLDLGPDLVAAAVIFAAVGLLTWHGWWMSRHAQALRGDVQRRVAEAGDTPALRPGPHRVHRGLPRRRRDRPLSLGARVADGGGRELGSARRRRARRRDGGGARLGGLPRRDAPQREALLHRDVSRAPARGRRALQHGPRQASGARLSAARSEEH